VEWLVAEKWCVDLLAKSIPASNQDSGSSSQKVYGQDDSIEQQV
jgi:hypothetical protein